MNLLLQQHCLYDAWGCRIIAGPNKQEIDQIIVDLQTMFNVSDEGDLTYYLGVDIENREDGTIKQSQQPLPDDDEPLPDTKASKSNAIYQMSQPPKWNELNQGSTLIMCLVEALVVAANDMLTQHDGAK